MEMPRRKLETLEAILVRQFSCIDRNLCQELVNDGLVYYEYSDEGYIINEAGIKYLEDNDEQLK